MTSGIARPHIGREVHARKERAKQMTDGRRPMFGQETPQKRLESRESFPGADMCLEKWKKESADLDAIKEALPSGNQLPHRAWKSN